MSSSSAPLFAGRYAILSELGRGGMGVVHRAEDTKLKREVAVKRISSTHLDGDSGERFFAEARACARVQSAHVVPVYDYGVLDDGEHYMVLELIEGRSLYAELKKNGRFPIERALHIGLQLCRGLGAAHDSGIIHRDLKPSNVMLVSRDGDADFVKILDFGVAKIIGEDFTTPGLVIGTLDYMAPEMVRGEPVDTRADMYALGVLLYRLVTGTRLFREKSSVPGFHNAFTEPEPISRRAFDLDIPPAFASAVMKCLAKDPDERFANMVELANALDGDATTPHSQIMERPSTSLAQDASPVSPSAVTKAGLPTQLLEGAEDSAPLSTPLTAFPTALGNEKRPAPFRPMFIGAAVALVLFALVGAAIFFIDPSTPTTPTLASTPAVVETGSESSKSDSKSNSPLVAPAAASDANHAKTVGDASASEMPPPTAAKKRLTPSPAKPSTPRRRPRRARRARANSGSNASDSATFERVRTSPTAPVFERVRTKDSP